MFYHLVRSEETVKYFSSEARNSEHVTWKVLSGYFISIRIGEWQRRGPARWVPKSANRVCFPVQCVDFLPYKFITTTTTTTTIIRF